MESPRQGESLRLPAPRGAALSAAAAAVRVRPGRQRGRTGARLPPASAGNRATARRADACSRRVASVLDGPRSRVAAGALDRTGAHAGGRRGAGRVHRFRGRRRTPGARLASGGAARGRQRHLRTARPAATERSAADSPCDGRFRHRTPAPGRCLGHTDAGALSAAQGRCRRPLGGPRRCGGERAVGGPMHACRMPE